MYTFFIAILFIESAISPHPPMESVSKISTICKISSMSWYPISINTMFLESTISPHLPMESISSHAADILPRASITNKQQAPFYSRLQYIIHNAYRRERDKMINTVYFHIHYKQATSPPFVPDHNAYSREREKLNLWLSCIIHKKATSCLFVPDQSSSQYLLKEKGKYSH